MPEYACRGEGPLFSSHRLGSTNAGSVPGGTPLHPLGHRVGPPHWNRYILPISCSCFEKETKMMAIEYFAGRRRQMAAIFSNLGFNSSPAREVVYNSKDNVLHILIWTMFHYPCPKHFSTAPACSWHSPMCESYDPEGTSQLKVVLGTQQSHDLTL